MFLTSLLFVGASAPEPAKPVGFDPTEPVVFADPPVMNEWTGAIKANVAFVDGDTDRTNVGVGADAEYRREKDRTTLKFIWNYAEDKDNKDLVPPAPHITQRQVFGSAKYDYFFSAKTYAYAEGSGAYDLKAGIDLRTTLGAGLGRQFREDEKWKVSGEGGVSYVDEDYEVDADDDEYAAARVAEKVEYKPSAKVTLSHTGEIFPSLEDSDDVFARADTKARFMFTDNFFAEIQWLFTWDNTPAEDPNAPGEHLNRTNDQYLLGVGWSF